MLKKSRNEFPSSARRALMLGGLAAGLTAALTLALGACSTNSSNTGATTSPTSGPSSSQSSSASTTSSSSATPSPTPTVAYQLSSGGRVTVSGDSTRWAADGGLLRVATSGAVKSGTQTARIAVDATSHTAGGPSGWILNLTTNGSGQVMDGTLDSPGVRYTVSKPSGKVVFAVNGGRLTVATQQAITVTQSGQAPTTMTIALTGTTSN